MTTDLRKPERMIQLIDIKSWGNLASTVFVPYNDSDYDRLVKMLDKLVDEVGEDGTHPLAFLMDVLSVLIGNYENANVPEPASG